MLTLQSYNEDEIVKIPLRNKKQDIVGHAIISKTDEENVNKHKWYLVKSGKKKNKFYVQTSINQVPIKLHQFILGRAIKSNVIDHIDGDGLCNIRINLRYASFSLNNQNKEKKRGISSKFIGVTRTKNKFVVQHKNLHYGYYNDEEEAAKIYDSVVLILSDGKAKTNNLVTYESVKDKSINDIVLIKRRQISYIQKRGKKYRVKITYKEQIFSKCKIKTIDEAKLVLYNFKQEIILLKEAEKINLTIERNKNNIAIIYAYNNKKEIVGESLVDDDKWHELYQMKWYMSEGYFKTGKNTLLHRYLMNASKDDLLVDHMNKNKLDNRISNLRFNTFAGNAHNKIKIENATSKYYGVYWQKTSQCWVACIMKDHIPYYLGRFDNEENAAAIYNIKARELYKEFANLNILENEEELLENMIPLKQSSSKYRGVFWNTHRHKWHTKFIFNSIIYNIGCFALEIDAAIAYNQKVREICPNDIKKLNIIQNEEEIIKNLMPKPKKFSGVSYSKERQKFVAYITFQKIRYNLGRYNSEYDAAKAYNTKAMEFYGKDYKHFNDLESL